jgi:hypothetical protein
MPDIRDKVNKISKEHKKFAFGLGMLCTGIIATSEGMYGLHQNSLSAPPAITQNSQLCNDIYKLESMSNKIRSEISLQTPYIQNEINEMYPSQIKRAEQLEGLTAKLKSKQDEIRASPEFINYKTSIKNCVKYALTAGFGMLLNIIGGSYIVRESYRMKREKPDKSYATGLQTKTA